MAAETDKESGQLGQALMTATSSAFFAAFDLVEYEPAQSIGGGEVWHGYRPGEARFQRYVTLNLQTDPAGLLDRLTLCLDRAGLSRPLEGAFMRHMCSDFLRWAVPSRDQAALVSLIAEIAHQETGELRAFPSPGYRTFLGHQGDADISLTASQLRIVNLNWRRHPDDVATPPGYDGETMWLWLIVRRLS